MKYTNYDFFMERLLKGLSKSDPDKNRTEKSLGSYLSPVIQQVDDYLISFDGSIIVNELYWKNSEKIVVFPENEDVLHKISSSKFLLKTYEGIKPFSDSFILNFPKGFKLSNRKTSSVLLTFISDGELDKKLIEPVYEEFGIGKEDEYQITELDGSIMMVVNFFTHEEKGLANNKLQIPFSSIPKIIESNNAVDYALLSSDGDLGAVVDHTEEEKNYNFELIKLISSILIYTQALDDVLVDGFPGQNSPNMNGRHIKLGKTKYMSLGISSNIPAEQRKGHYRGWHFRQLTDDRYYKGEFKNMVKGSRIIFVKDSYVNTEVTPKTLLHKTQKRPQL